MKQKVRAHCAGCAVLDLQETPSAPWDEQSHWGYFVQVLY
jgi:hypothetical protein